MKPIHLASLAKSAARDAVAQHAVSPTDAENTLHGIKAICHLFDPALKQELAHILEGHPLAELALSPIFPAPTAKNITAQVCTVWVSAHWDAPRAALRLYLEKVPDLLTPSPDSKFRVRRRNEPKDLAEWLKVSPRRVIGWAESGRTPPLQMIPAIAAFLADPTVAKQHPPEHFYSTLP